MCREERVQEKKKSPFLSVYQSTCILVHCSMPVNLSHLKEKKRKLLFSLIYFAPFYWMQICFSTLLIWEIGANGPELLFKLYFWSKPFRCDTNFPNHFTWGKNGPFKWNPIKWAVNFVRAMQLSLFFFLLFQDIVWSINFFYYFFLNIR